MKTIVRESRVIQCHEIVTLCEEGSGLGGGSIIGTWKSGFESGGSGSSGTLDRWCAACISSLTLHEEVAQFTKVCTEV